MYVKPFICVVGKYLLQYLLKCALHLSLWRLKCYYNQRNSVGTDRENIVPGNLCIIWKLSEAWPIIKDSITFLRLLKHLKLKKNSITAWRILKFLILKKDTTTVLNFLILKKDSITSLRLLKFLILKNDSIMTLKVFQSSYSVECWWTAASFLDQVFLEWGDWYLF